MAKKSKGLSNPPAEAPGFPEQEYQASVQSKVPASEYVPGGAAKTGPNSPLKSGG
jgi:hypothetical protein